MGVTRASAFSLTKSKFTIRLHSNQAYFLTRVFAGLAVLATCSSHAVAQASPSSEQIRGVVVNVQSPAAGNVSLELRDLRGVRFASSATDADGAFAIAAPPQRGEYILLASKGPFLVGQEIVWEGGRPEYRITLPAVSLQTGPKHDGNTISVNRLGTSEKTRNYIHLAEQKFSDLRFDEALQDLTHALEQDPRCAAALTMRAFVRLAEKDPQGAAEDATRAVALDPDGEESYIALATALNSLGEFKKAAEASVQTLMLDIDSWQARLELAKSLYGQKQFVLALHELDLLDKDFPDVRLVRGNTLARLGRREEARTEFAAFLERFPDDPRAPQVRQVLSNR